MATPDLTELVGSSRSETWRVHPDTGEQSRLLSGIEVSEFGLGSNFLIASGDLSRVLRLLRGDHDPARSVPAGSSQLYDVSSGGTPQLVGLLPGGGVPACGIPVIGAAGYFLLSPDALSADGSLLVFPSNGNGPCTGTGAELYLSDLDAGRPS